MPKTAIFPPGAGPTLAPYSPGTSADGIVYVSGTLALDKEFNVENFFGWVSSVDEFRTALQANINPHSTPDGANVKGET